MDWREAEGTMLCSVIAGSPDNIVRLPPPLTDEQREQLKAIWTLGGRWLVKDDYKDKVVFVFADKPYKKDGGYWLSDVSVRFLASQKPCVCKLVSWSDPEPYDIAKALGVGK